MTMIATLKIEIKTNDEIVAAERAWELAEGLVALHADVEDVKVERVD